MLGSIMSSSCTERLVDELGETAPSIAKLVGLERDPTDTGLTETSSSMALNLHSRPVLKPQVAKVVQVK
jgi:hypothetical protein